MRVDQIMRREPRTCSASDTAWTAGRLMGEIGSGWLPVVHRGQPVGVVTDRDLCLALAECDARPSEVVVEAAMSVPVHHCRLDDDVSDALALMRDKHVHRLLVVDADGVFAGMLSLDDVALAAEHDGELSAGVLATLRALVEHPALVVSG